MNHEILEVMDIVPAFVPVDMQTAANGSNWVNMAKCARVLCVVFKGAGTAGDNPVVTINQATDNAGTSSKALTFTKARSKIGAIATAANQVWTTVTQAAAGTWTPTSAASVALLAVEIRATDLDIANGFNHVQLTVPDIGSNAQLGCGFYIVFGVKYPQQTQATFLD
jgi:hypothetical protein